MIRLIVFFMCWSGLAAAQQSVLTGIYNRPGKSLEGEWHYIVDPYENGYYNYRYEAYDQQKNPGTGAFFLNSKPLERSDLVEYDFDRSEVMQVPGDWNTQKENLFYYEGTIWYKRGFDFVKTDPKNRVFLYFGAANYLAEVYLNGVKLGVHEGGFTPFNFEITSMLKEDDNFLIVKVDNKRIKEGVPTLNTDWWNYGGITREVKVVEVPEIFIRDYFLQLDPENELKIKGYVKLDGGSKSKKEVQVRIPELGIEQAIATDENGVGTIELSVDQVEYWSPETPRLYVVSLSAGEDTLVDQIGFRTIRTQGDEILLNGKPLFLRGISIHEERPGGGRVRTREEARQLLSWAKELGCNYVRLAHYPHNENMARLADEMGILVWEEIPVYWTIDWANEETYQNAENQLTGLIARDKNRASVIIWSMANETPVGEARNRFLTRLAARARSFDPTRLISAALEQRGYQGDPNIRTIEDPFAEVVDVLSFNQYIGSYDGLPDKCRQISWKIAQDKPVLISEFGAGAKYGFHADSLTRFSEEYQAWLYEETLRMLDHIENLRGFTPWILMDFRSPRRPLPGIQDGWNRKGLISEKGEKKMAFFVLRDFYRKKAGLEQRK